MYVPAVQNGRRSGCGQPRGAAPDAEGCEGAVPGCSCRVWLGRFGGFPTGKKSLAGRGSTRRGSSSRRASQPPSQISERIYGIPTFSHSPAEALLIIQFRPRTRSRAFFNYRIRACYRPSVRTYHALCTVRISQLYLRL